MQGKKIKISIEPIGRRIILDSPARGLDAIMEAGIGIKSVCGGKGTCGKCRIIILDEDNARAFEPTGQEKKVLSADEISHGVRLACQHIFDRDINIYIPASSLSEEQKLQVTGEEKILKIDPVVKKYYLELERATLNDLRSDMTRLKDALDKEYKVTVKNIDPSVLKEMSSIIRKEAWKITVTIREGEIIKIESGDMTKKCFGLAMDLGTTKVAILLVDLISGRTIDSMGIMNPQISFGEDVMSRLNFAIQGPDNAERIKGVLVDRINESVTDLCSRNSLKSDDILEMVIVANTAMHHLLMGLPVKQLALSPFVSAISDSLHVKAEQLGIRLAPGAYIYLPPPIAGFVGSDHLAMILASGIRNMSGNLLALDIGTNTEIALKSGSNITSVSTASGPAFEGAHIKHGMRAAPGAIEKVLIDPENLVPVIQTIGDKKPVGICGSGILDSVAELLKVGIIDSRGKFVNDSAYVCRDEKGKNRYILSEYNEKYKDGAGGGAGEASAAAAEEKPEVYLGLPCGNKDISINQQDIVEIQLAKGAMRTGIEVLLENAGIVFKDIDRIIVAGAFGSYIDPKNVVNIGMFPKVPLNHIRQVGNAAGVGAKMMLVSMAERKEAEKTAEEVKYLELTVFPSFTDHFVDSIKFPAPEELI
ncbi:MAG: DUF4445 domain-containing protein [Actinobacteria bacterium]|nr:DUF4445 domain-containing protein [Actinomycetota bacterium]